MAADDRAKTGRRRVQVEFVKVVKDINPEWAHLDPFSLAQRLGPFAPVHVPSNRDHGGDAPQDRENLRVPYISRVNDPFHALEGIDYRRPDQAMGVRNHADQAIFGSLHILKGVTLLLHF